MIPAAALDIIKAAEAGAGINAKHDKGPRKGLYMFRTCYLDGGGVPTIGYGNTSTVTKADVNVKTISAEEAERLLVLDVMVAERALDRACDKAGVMLNPNERGALVSWVFNLGIQRLVGGGPHKRSTAWTRLLAGDREGCAEAMQWFNKDGTGPGGALEVQAGLVIRRKAEAKLFLTPYKA
jgi:GH24 family phage-related lysozyme (muramidase)